MKKNNKILITVFAVGVVLTLITATFAWFSYSKSGSKNNTITAGSIKFHYEEGSNAISVDDMMPMTDEQGMSQDDYFEFDISASTPSTAQLPYYITAVRSGTGTNMDGVVKVYLTRVIQFDDIAGEIPIPILPGKTIATVSELNGYINEKLNIGAAKGEKILYNDLVPESVSDYHETYRLRMWIDNETQYLTKQTKYYCDGTEVSYSSSEYTNCDPSLLTSRIVDAYPYQDKTYILNVNVYSDGKIYNPPKIASCPGCRFLRASSFLSSRSISFNDESPAFLDAIDTTADYNDILQMNINTFAGVVLSDGDHGKVERVFACGLIDANSTEPICIEGSKPELYDTYKSSLTNETTGMFGIKTGTDIYNKNIRGCYESGVNINGKDEHILHCDSAAAIEMISNGEIRITYGYYSSYVLIRNPYNKFGWEYSVPQYQ